jgi:hypothetical protein
MNALTIVNFNEKPYYIADDVRTNAPAYFYGTSQGIRKIIDKKSIPQEHYTYGIKGLKTRQYTLSDASSKKSTLFLSVDWVKTHIFPTENKDDTTKTNTIETTETKETTNDVVYALSPPLIVLNDDEKLQDDKGNVVEIETCGEKTRDGIYFYSKDVERVLEISSIGHILRQEDCKYEEGIHYKKFIRKGGENLSYLGNNQITIYLTYRGLLRFLFTRRHPIAERFATWATNVLFTMQMGTQSDKVELFSKSLGFEPRVITEVLDRNAMTLPCIYLLSLGKVKELRQSMNIPPHFADDAIVCKYGRTENFKRRLAEHGSKYNKGINNAFVRVLRYTHIDPINASSAESALAKLMNSINSRIQYRDETELVVVSRDFEDYINTQFTHLGKSFMGHTTELNARIQELENQLKQQQLEHTIVSQNHTIELQKLQHANEMKDVLLTKKDLEIEILKLKAVAK